MKNDAFRLALEKAPVPEAVVGLRRVADSQYGDFEHEFQKLAKPERYLAVQYRDQLAANEKLVKIAPRDAANFVTSVQSGDFGLGIGDWREIVLLIGSQTCGFFLIMFILFAFLFRGGVAYWVAGIALVQRDGRRASRWKCTLRELVLWLPLIVVLLLTGLVQVLWPGWFTGRIIASGIAVAVLVGYVALGLRHPEQGPLDRLFGTCRVPL